jgi:hypothetical protein
MEKAVPVRKPHTNTADLLAWSATGPDAVDASPAAASRPNLKVRTLPVSPWWRHWRVGNEPVFLHDAADLSLFLAAGCGDHASDVRRAGERPGRGGSEQDVRSVDSRSRIPS